MEETGVHLKTDKLAFTLVELLVVVAVFGILSGLLIAALGGTRKKAQAVACLSNERQILAGALLYAGEHNGVLPEPFDIMAGVHPDHPGFYQGLITLLEPYTGEERKVFYCTDAIHASVDGTNFYTYQYQSTRTDGKRFNQLGYYWAAASGGGWYPPHRQTVMGSPNRMLVACVTIDGYKGVHGGIVNFGFVDGSVRSLAKTMNFDFDPDTLEMRK